MFRSIIAPVGGIRKIKTGIAKNAADFDSRRMRQDVQLSGSRSIRTDLRVSALNADTDVR